MTPPRLYADLWLHEAFTAEQLNAREYQSGFGLDLTLGESRIHVVFGARSAGRDAGVLAGQEAAARKAAEVFTAIADRLAALGPGTRVRVHTDTGTTVCMILNDAQAQGRACVVCKATTTPMTPVGTVTGHGQVLACTAHEFTFDTDPGSGVAA